MRPDAVSEAVDLIAEATIDENILRLLQCGWYVPQGIRLRTVFDLAGLVSDGQGAAAEEIIMLFFRKNLGALEDYLCSRHPDFPSIAEAFCAHGKKLYGASALLILSTVNGICIKNIDYLRSRISRGDLLNNRSINELLDRQASFSGFFDAGRRGALLSGQGTCGQRESFMAMSLLAFVTDFLASVQAP